MLVSLVMAFELIVLLSLPLMLGSWLDHGCTRRPYFLYTQLNFIIKQLYHGNVLPIGGSKCGLSVGEPEQSDLEA